LQAQDRQESPCARLNLDERTLLDIELDLAFQRGQLRREGIALPAALAFQRGRRFFHRIRITESGQQLAHAFGADAELAGRRIGLLVPLRTQANFSVRVAHLHLPDRPALRGLHRVSRQLAERFFLISQLVDLQIDAGQFG